MVTQKQKEISKLLKEMEEVMRTKGLLPLPYAMHFLNLGMSISQNFEDMETSRDKWKEKYNETLLVKNPAEGYPTLEEIDEFNDKCGCSMENRITCEKHAGEMYE